MHTCMLLALVNNIQAQAASLQEWMMPGDEMLVSTSTSTSVTLGDGFSPFDSGSLGGPFGVGGSFGSSGFGSGGTDRSAATAQAIAEKLKDDPLYDEDNLLPCFTKILASGLSKGVVYKVQPLYSKHAASNL